MLKQMVFFGLLGLPAFNVAFSQESQFCDYRGENNNQEQIITKCFEPSEEGQPLPLKNARAAERWPEDFRDFIDRAVRLFKENQYALSVDDIRSALNVSVIYKSNGAEKKSYTIKHLPFSIFKRDIPGQQITFFERRDGREISAMMIFGVNWKHICIDPYDLAIYFGVEFSGLENRSHVKVPRVWRPAYQWGMFDRHATLVYHSQNLLIVLASDYGAALKGVSPDCIAEIRVFSPYRKEK